MSSVLEGLRVLDISTILAGPYCAMQLGAMGAEVIRIEPPGGAIDRELGPFSPNGYGMYPWHYSCNKMAVTLNLKKEKGQEILRRLLAKSDVLVESMAPAAKKKFGLDWESLNKIDPRLILLSISGYGQYGPYSNRGGFDMVAQAMSGIMAVTGPEGGEPTRAGVAMVDYGAALYGLSGVMTALYQREHTGRGQSIDISLLDVAVSFMETVFAEKALLGLERKGIGNRRPYTAPTNMFKAKDGYVYLAVSTDYMWQRFCKIAGLEDIKDDPRYNSTRVRYKHQVELNRITAEWVAEQTVQEVLDKAIPANIAAGQVYSVSEAMADEHIKAREMIVEMDYPGCDPVPIPGMALKMSEAGGSYHTPCPDVGESNDQVYRGILGLSDQEMADLAEDGVI